MIEPGPRPLRSRVRYDCSVRSAVRGGSSPHTTSTRRHTGTAVPADKASAASTAWHFAGPVSSGSPRSVNAPTSPSRRIRTCRVPVEPASADSTLSQPAYGRNPTTDRHPQLMTAIARERLMKAIVQERFGPPDVLRLADADVPKAGPGEVVIRVHAAALNPYDWHMLRGDPRIARLIGATGLTRPKDRVAGIDAAGRVEATGPGVRGLRPGDEVLGLCSGAFAEYALAKADLMVPKPAGLSFEQAAAVPMAATTALRAIQQVGEVRSGHRVLVNGAAGGVGTFAVQIAAALGAEVTGVCSTRNVDLVRSLGAGHVIDYTTGDFTDGPTRYDVIL